MGTKDNLDSLAPHLDPTGLKPPTGSTKTPHQTPEANPSSWVWPQGKWFSFLMNLGCVDPVKRGKLSLPNKDRNKTLSLTLLLLKGTGGFEPPRWQEQPNTKSLLPKSTVAPRKYILGHLDLLLLMFCSCSLWTQWSKSSRGMRLFSGLWYAQHIRSPGGRSAAAPSAGRWPSPENGITWKKHKPDLLSCTTETKMGPTIIKITRDI